MRARLRVTALSLIRPNVAMWLADVRAVESLLRDVLIEQLHQLRRHCEEGFLSGLIILKVGSITLEGAAAEFNTRLDVESELDSGIEHVIISGGERVPAKEVGQPGH